MKTYKTTVILNRIKDAQDNMSSSIVSNAWNIPAF